MYLQAEKGTAWTHLCRKGFKIEHYLFLSHRTTHPNTDAHCFLSAHAESCCSHWKRKENLERKKTERKDLLQISQRQIPKMKSWAWNREGPFKKDGSQMCSRWHLSNCLHDSVAQMLTWFSYVLIQEALSCLFAFSKCFLLQENVFRPSLRLGCIIRLRWDHYVLTCGSAGSPEDLTSYLPDSGEDQEHSVRSASSGSQGLWANHAEQKSWKTFREPK